MHVLCLSLLVLLTFAENSVKTEWKVLGTPFRSPFAPPGVTTPHALKKFGNRHEMDNTNHGNSKSKHTHHDPHGDKIVAVSKKVSGQCGGKAYVPRSQICCNGKVLHRQGMRPACCGDMVYDFVFDLCCKGNEVRPRTVERPFC